MGIKMFKGLHIELKQAQFRSKHVSTQIKTFQFKILAKTLS